MIGRLVAVAASVPVLAWLAAEAVHAAAAARLPRGRPGGPGVVIVLGCPSEPDGSASPLQRWRVDLGLRTGPEAVMIFTGAHGEAETMAADARARYGLPTERTLIEPRATTTWENVSHAAPLVSPGAEVAIASDPLHTSRALAYWREQFPDRPVRAGRGHRFGEHPILIVRTAIYEVVLRLMGYRPPGAPRLAPDHGAR
jgi:hypothetical protein